MDALIGPPEFKPYHVLTADLNDDGRLDLTSHAGSRVKWEMSETTILKEVSS